MSWRVKVRAGVFATSEIVPVPVWACIVVFRDPFDTKSLDLTKLLWQLKRWKVLAQSLSQVDGM